MKTTQTITFKLGYVDITDPCYDKTYWARLRGELPPGEYDYAANIDDVVKSICILRKGWEGCAQSKFIGYIGVDAGLAGFFDNKPDYNDDEWLDVCNFIWKQHNKVCEAHLDNAMRCEGVFSSSGYGDGEYPVYQLVSDYTGVIVGYEIKFI